MDAFKTILMGCGVLAILSVVGCVGLTSAGYYAVGQAIEEQQALEASQGYSSRPKRGETSSSSDPFSDYESGTYDESSDNSADDSGDWGNEAQ